jgi:hypothetical protein
MGRIRTKSKKTTALVESTPDNKPSKASPTIPALLEKAQGLIVQCNYELAQQFARRILENEPQHADAREMLGVCQLEMGDLDEAKEVRPSMYRVLVFVPQSSADIRDTCATLRQCSQATTTFCIPLPSTA